MGVRRVLPVLGLLGVLLFPIFGTLSYATLGGEIDPSELTIISAVSGLASQPVQIKQDSTTATALWTDLNSDTNVDAFEITDIQSGVLFENGLVNITTLSDFIIATAIFENLEFECIITLNQSIILNLESGETSEIINKAIECNKGSDHSNVEITDDCVLNEINLADAGRTRIAILFDEVIENLGDSSEEHCMVTFSLTSPLSEETTEVSQDIWINMGIDKPIGGTVGSLDTATLLVAGAQSNMGLLSLALIGAVASGAIAYKIKANKKQ